MRNMYDHVTNKPRACVYLFFLFGHLQREREREREEGREAEIRDRREEKGGGGRGERIPQ